MINHLFIFIAFHRESHDPSTFSIFPSQYYFTIVHPYFLHLGNRISMFSEEIFRLLIKKQNYTVDQVGA
jgi:hypothetical protein